MDKFITCTKRSCDDDASSAPTPKKCKTRKYDISYLQFGFTVAGTDAELLPQCVICTDLLANDSMKPCKLKRHLETKHPTLKDKSLNCFYIKLSGLEQKKRNLSKHTSVSNRFLDASYYISKRVAKVGKPHTIAEVLILPKISVRSCSEIILLSRLVTSPFLTTLLAVAYLTWQATLKSNC